MSKVTHWMSHFIKGIRLNIYKELTNIARILSISQSNSPKMKKTIRRPSAGCKEIVAVFGITFRSRTRTAKSNEQLENECWLVKFWKPFVNWFSPSDGRGNFGAFSTCLRREIQFLYRTKKLPNSASDRSLLTFWSKSYCIINSTSVYVDMDRLMEILFNSSLHKV